MLRLVPYGNCQTAKYLCSIQNASSRAISDDVWNTRAISPPAFAAVACDGAQQDAMT